MEVGAQQVGDAVTAAVTPTVTSTAAAAAVTSTAEHTTTCNVLLLNLPFRVRWQDLKDLCRRACPIVRADVALEPEGRSRGFGEVTVASRQDADKLVAMFDGFSWQGRVLNLVVLEHTSALVGFPPVPPAPERSLAQDFQALSFAQQPTFQPLQTSQPNYPLQTSQPVFPLQTSQTGQTIQSGRSNQPFGEQSQGQQINALDGRLLFVGNLPFSVQWQELKDLLRPAGRILRADVALSFDGRSRGWGTAVFATAEEATKAIALFDNTLFEGRIMEVRLDRYAGRGIALPLLQPRSGSAVARSLQVQRPMVSLARVGQTPGRPPRQQQQPHRYQQQQQQQLAMQQDYSMRGYAAYGTASGLYQQGPVGPLQQQHGQQAYPYRGQTQHGQQQMQLQMQPQQSQQPEAYPQPGYQMGSGLYGPPEPPYYEYPPY